MRWALGFRSLRLPCVVWLVFLSLAAGPGAGDWAATARKDDAGGGAVPTSLADLASPLSAADLEVTGGAEGARAAARRGKAESAEVAPREHRGGRRLDEEEASRILWRGWLLVDEAASRRKAHITPKSVFIAPVIRGGDGIRGGGIPACAEGYRSDAMGRCHKVVRVNQAAHLDFLLQRLNALYGEPSSGSSQGEADKGPLLVTIPLATDPPREAEEGEEGEDGDDDEDDGRVDLVVVAEASIQEGPLKDLTASFTGLEEQVVAENHDGTVAKGEAGLAVDGAEKKAINKSSADGFVPEIEKRKYGGSEVVKNATNDQSHESTGKPIVVEPITNRPELGEPVTFWESENTTEETSEQTEIPVTESTMVPTTDDRFVQTTTFEPTENPSESTESEGTTSDEHFPNTHIYETTFITDYPTTSSYDNKVTVMPEVLHKASEDVGPDSSFSIRNKSDDVKSDPPSRVVFPGKVSERVRFPDSDDQETGYPSQPVSSASSLSPSVTSSTSSKAASRPWGGWNRPMLLKFWTQMPLIREPSHGSESTIKRASATPSGGDVPAHLKRGESWSFPIHSGTQGQVNHGPYQRRPWIYYQELSPREMASVSRVFDRVRHYENHG